MGRAFAAVLMSMILCFPAFAGKQKVSPPIGTNWEQYAKSFLWVRAHNRLFDPALDKDGLRCVKMNNYGCLWQSKANWKGTPGPDGSNGAHDGAGGNNGHAIFVHPKWSLVAALDWFYKRSEPSRSPLALAEVYSPWCDTIGSAGTRKDRHGKVWGRGCSGGKQPPKNFKGPICGKPPSGTPAKGQCDACNCPNSVATFWLRSTGLPISEPLSLFDQGKPNTTMRTILINKIALETGRFQPTKELVDAAFDEFSP